MQRLTDHKHDIAALFQAKSIALVGASDRRGSLGKVVFNNLTTSGFEGPVYPVNPGRKTVDGNPCFDSVSTIGEQVDLAVIACPAASVPEVIDECGAAGVTAAVILSAGFREAGEAGKSLEVATIENARKHGIRFIGPNCLGVMRPDTGLNATFSQSMAKPGQIALVSQSGAMCTAMLDWAGPRNIGFSCVVSSGIAADIDFGEILDYLVFDPLTKAIMLYVEGIHDARRFMSALRAASRAKPVIVMKAGRYAEGSKAAMSHTGALVGSDDVFDAALRRCGVVRVHNYADFYAIAETLDTGVRTKGPRLAIVTNGGGPGVMAADFLADKGLPLARLGDSTTARLAQLLPDAWSGANPVDVLGDASADLYVGAVAACLDDDDVDAVLGILIPTALTDATAIAEAICTLNAAQTKPILSCWMGDTSMRTSRERFRSHAIPTYATPEAAVEAFAATAAYQANQQLLLQVPEPLSPRAKPDREGARLIIESALAEGRKVLDIVESKALLAAFGIPIVRSTPAHSPSEALAIAEAIGFPVAMKIHSADISHKSDLGGVKLGITSGAEVRAAYHELTDVPQRRQAEAKISGVTIEPMCSPRDGRELMLGVVNDAVFGPVISVGLGGTMVEVVRDRVIGLPPLNRFLAGRMIDGTRASRYLEKFRGKAAASRDAVEDVILRLSDMVCELPWLEELDINPLLVDWEQAWAVDARVAIHRINPSARQYSHMAIHPYPIDLVGEEVLADGTRLLIRPIRPEDARLEEDFVNGLSESSRRLRFMYALRKITPRMVSGFTQIDYDREMALVAQVSRNGEDKQVGVARYVTHPDHHGCEFAIVVSDEWQNRGIATELMRRLINIAKERHLGYMDGVVLHENKGMIAFAKELGFEQRRSADDPAVVLMSLQL